MKLDLAKRFPYIRPYILSIVSGKLSMIHIITISITGPWKLNKSLKRVFLNQLQVKGSQLIIIIKLDGFGKVESRPVLHTETGACNA